MRKTVFQTFAAPFLLLAVTVAGLIAGVVADGWADVVAVAALATPLLAMAAGVLLPRGDATRGGHGVSDPD